MSDTTSSCIFDIKVVIPTDDIKKAWKMFQKTPTKFLPKDIDERIEVVEAKSGLRCIKCYGKRPDITKYQLQYAKYFGWSLNPKGFWIKKDEEPDILEPRCAVMAWGSGWAPWHSACGILDNAAWGDLRPALRVADEIFFGVKHFKPDQGVCAYCCTDISYEDIFCFEGEVFCGTACAIK